MQYVDFGRTGLRVSRLGFGGIPVQRIDEPGTRAMLKAAHEAGINYIDTARAYTVSEEWIGQALEELGLRDEFILATKCRALTKAEMEAELAASLKNLRTDHIDLYFQHRIDPNVEPETVAEVMADLIREGKITHWGISEANEDYLRRAHAVCPVTAVQNRYSMMARHYEPLFPILEELDVGLVAFSPMANGFLTGQYGKGQRFDAATDYRAAMPQFTDKAVDQNAALLKLLADMAAEKGATSAQISMAWMLCKHPWIVPIPGTRKEDRMKENAGAASVFLTPSEVRALDDTLDHMDMSAVFGGTPLK